MIESIVRFMQAIPEEYYYSNLRLKEGYYFIIPQANIENNSIENIQCYEINKQKAKDLINNIENVVVPENLYAYDYYSNILEMAKPFDKGKKIHSSNYHSLFFKSENLSKVPENYADYIAQFKNKEFWEEDEDYDAIVQEIDKYYKYFNDNLQQLIKLITNPDDGKYIKFFVDKDIDLYKKSFTRFHKIKIFLDKNYSNKENTEGVSNFLNTFNSKKAFLPHQTAKFYINQKITSEEAFSLHHFKKLMENGKLPKIFPVFIINEEINHSLVKIFREDGLLSLSEILSRLYKDKKRLNHYYLITWKREGMGSVIIRDFDYVESFNYELDATIYNIADYSKKDADGVMQPVKNIKLENIFSFEREVIPLLFNNTLVGFNNKENKFYYKYFEDVTTKDAVTAQNLYSYSENIFNYIYKSQENAITAYDFYNLVISSIKGDFRDEKNGSFKIKQKLNVLFSLNPLFDKENFNNKRGVIMPSVLMELKEKLSSVISDEDQHIDTDELFAYAAGQLIFYINSQNKGSNRTLSLIEPYIHKADPEKFKMEISKGIDQYKHAINFGTKKFPALASEVLGYNTKRNIKELLPIILTGYFSNNILYQKEELKTV